MRLGGNRSWMLLGCGSLLGASAVGVVPALLLVTLTSGSGRVSDAERDSYGLAPPEEAEEAGLAMDDAMPMRARRRPSQATAGAPPPAAKVAERAAAAPMADTEEPSAKAEGEPGGDGEPRSRQWFPESFLWAPRVQTGDEGVAHLDLTVPDQLTTWRILGLAHDRGGQQTGAVHTFDSRLPLYVEPVVPGWLYAGDEVELPVQVVNTTDTPAAGTLRVSGEGAIAGRSEGPLSLGAQGSAVRRVQMRARGAGTARVTATWQSGSGDEASRSVPVLPAGRPVRTSRSGSVATSRGLALRAPQGADPQTQELGVRVFPGPLAVLQAELERVGSGQTQPTDGAYGFALAGQLGALAARTGVEVPAQTVRKLQIVAWQRIARQARAPDAGQAADLLVALSGVEDHALAEGIRPRLVHALLQGQRGDGTWARRADATLQEVLVQTAFAARALPDAERGARLRASGAIERYQGEVRDPYTAAVILAAGLAEGAVKERLAEEVRAAVRVGADGGVSLDLPDGVRNPWGSRPRSAEALAFLALAVDEPQLGGDLVAALMGGYDAGRGLGAGRADALALEAVIRWMPALDTPVDAVLVQGGRELARAQVDPGQPRVPAVLTATGLADLEGLELRMEPDAPGLSFVAELLSYVPWSDDDRLPGVEVRVDPGPLAVGRDGVLNLAVSAPSGETLTLEQGLPAGATVDGEGLEKLVRSGTLTGYQVLTDRVRVTTRRFQAGEVLELALPVRAAFAGRFQTGPLLIERRDGANVALPPVTWQVASQQR